MDTSIRSSSGARLSWFSISFTSNADVLAPPRRLRGVARSETFENGNRSVEPVAQVVVLQLA